VSITRIASYGFFEAALEAARKGADPTVYADAAVEAGRVYWRKYDALANRWSTVSGRACLFTQWLDPRYFVPTKADSNLPVAGGKRIAQSELLKDAMPLPFDAAGEADYLRAEALFREAYDAQPSFERAYRQLAMLLVDRNRWADLSHVARTRVAVAPWDAWAWLTLGLASQRMGNPRLATAAFDSGLRMLPPADRQRLDRLERVLPLADSARLGNVTDATRAALQRHYWLSADPLWSKQDAEPRIEFLARVTYAELRWTVEEMKVRGADTDRGEVHIRFGPADLIAVFGPPPDVCTLWAYNVGYLFRFTGQGTFATAKYGDEEAAAAIMETSPARWDNLPLPRIDSMPTVAARFRAPADSVDVFIATVPPLDAIRKSAEVRGTVRSDFWVLAGGTVPVVRDSTVPAQSGLKTYTLRLPQGNYVYRTEASAEGARVAGRASAVVVAGPDSVTGFTTHGFGISDIVLATRSDATAPGRRWSDVSFTPLLGAATAGSQLALIWETYDLGADASSAHYTVRILLVRQQSLKGRIAARIVGSVAGRVGIDAADDRLSMNFDRNVPHGATLLDNISLSLGETPAGRYRLTVEITDKTTGKVTARSVGLEIR
jgi:GWxTD domain-containing protein